MASVACNQKNIQEFSEHNGKFICMKELCHCIKILTSGPEPRVCEGKSGESHEVGMMGECGYCK